MTSRSTTGYDGWKIATSVKLHFDGSFDAIKYNFSMPNLTYSAFDKRRDKYIYERLARKYTTYESFCWFVAANILAGNVWIGDMRDEVYHVHLGQLERFSYTFTGDVKKLAEIEPNLDKLLTMDSGDELPPSIMRAFFEGVGSLETITAINNLTGFVNQDALQSVNDPMGIWKDMTRRIKQYGPFLRTKYDSEKTKQILIKEFTFN